MQTLFATLRRLAADYWLAMCKLNQIQFSAPWNPRKSRCG